MREELTYVFSCRGPGMSNLIIRSGPALEVGSQARVKFGGGRG